MSAPALLVQVQGVTNVSADNLNTYEQTCDTSSELAAFVGVDGMQVFLRGLSAPGDGGQGPFYWADGVFANDGVNVIVPIGAYNGAWLRLPLNLVVPLAPLVSTSGTTILKNQGFVPINNTTGGAFAINLPSAPVNGENHTVKDWLGNAATYNITINGNGYNIDGAGSFTFNSNYQAANFLFAYTKWGVW